MAGLLEEIAGVLEAARLSKRQELDGRIDDVAIWDVLEAARLSERQERRQAKPSWIILRDFLGVSSEGDGGESGGDGDGGGWDFGGWFD